MRPFSPRFYDTAVTHVARAVEREDGEEVESWPGAGTALLANVSQGMPQDRFGNQIEETTTGWVLWFSYQAIVDAAVTIARGDQIRIAQAVGDAIVLRVNANATDFNQKHVSFMVQASQVV